jgi:transketolase
MLSASEINYLEDKAKDIRISIIEMLLAAGSGHTAGPLGMADIFSVLYGKVLKHDPKNPTWTDRDRLVLSNGHICPVLYSSMAHYGYFPVSELKTLRKFGSRLQGHPHREFLPILETSSGPLGSGLSQAVGMCLADRIGTAPLSNGEGLGVGRTRKYFYCLLGDGELDEGQNWEAIMLAGKEKLGNLICIVDRNNIQIDGFTENIMPLEPIDKKWEAFNFDVQVVNGHDMGEIYSAVEKAKAVFNKPSVIIARTIPGKGVAEFEKDFHYHGYLQNKSDGEIALKRLNELRNFGSHLDSHHN